MKYKFKAKKFFTFILVLVVVAVGIILWQNNSTNTEKLQERYENTYTNYAKQILQNKDRDSALNAINCEDSKKCLDKLDSILIKLSKISEKQEFNLEADKKITSYTFSKLTLENLYELAKKQDLTDYEKIKASEELNNMRSYVLDYE